MASTLVQVAGPSGLQELELILQALEARCAAAEEEVRAAEGAARDAAQSQAEADLTVTSIEAQISAVLDGDPAVKEQVLAMTKAQLNEVKSLRSSPPAAVRRSMETVWVVLHCSQWAQGDSALQALDLSKDWPKIQRMLTADGFVQSVVAFDRAQLDAMPWVLDYLVSRYFSDLGPAGLQAEPPAMSASSSEQAPRSNLAPPQLGASDAMGPRRSNPAPGSPARSTSKTAPVLRAPSSPSLKSAGLAAVASTRLSGNLAQGPLDVAAVERASKACGVLVRWSWQVVREAILLRGLRAQRVEAATLAAARATAAEQRRAAAAVAVDRLQASQAELEAARARLAALRGQVASAEKAALDLAKLQFLQDQFGAERKPKPAPPEPRRAPEDLRELATIGDLMRFMQDAKAGSVPPTVVKATLDRVVADAAGKSAASAPPARAAPPEAKPVQVTAALPVACEDRDKDILLDASPLAPFLLAPRVAAKGGPERAEEEPWLVEFGCNEVEVCQRSSTYYRDQRKACDALAKHLTTNRDMVVALQGFACPHEDAGVASARAAGVAKWLLESGVRGSQLRLEWPPPGAMVDSSAADSAAVPPGSQQGGGQEEEEDNNEDGDAEDDEEGEDEDEGDAADRSKGPRWPERRVMAKQLREVRVLAGPRVGDREQSAKLGIFFAAEDYALDSLGPGTLRIVRRIAHHLQQVFAEEGRRPIIVEGHSDEGIEDDLVLDWLAENRAEAVRSYLLEIAGEKLEPEGALDAAAQEGAAVAEPTGTCDDRAAAGAGEEEAAAEPAPAPPPLLRACDVVACSMGRRHRVTQEYGRKGLNRRVQIFIV